jgi:hypothetical protein
LILIEENTILKVSFIAIASLFDLLRKTTLSLANSIEENRFNKSKDLFRKIFDSNNG